MMEKQLYIYRIAIHEIYERIQFQWQTFLKNFKSLSLYVCFFTKNIKQSLIIYYLTFYNIQHFFIYN